MTSQIHWILQLYLVLIFLTSLVLGALSTSKKSDLIRTQLCSWNWGEHYKMLGRKRCRPFFRFKHMWDIKLGVRRWGRHSVCPSVYQSLDALQHLIFARRSSVGGSLNSLFTLISYPIADRIMAPIISGMLRVWPENISTTPAYNTLHQAIYFLMMASKFYQSMIRMRRSGTRLKLPIVDTFVKDGTFYFFLWVS